MLDPSVPFVLRAPTLLAGGAALAAALVMGGRRSDRTRYRPDRWLLAEWVVSLCGLVAVVGVVVSGRLGDTLDPSVYPLELPELPVAAALGVLVAVLPAWVAPEPPELATVPSAVEADGGGPGAGGGRVIRFEHVTFTYPDAEVPTLVDVDFVVPEGELCLVVGTTGSGKSTLLRAVNGLVPRFSGGTLQGRVWVDGRSTDERAAPRAGRRRGPAWARTRPPGSSPTWSRTSSPT